MKKDAARDALVQEARELIVAMEAALLQIESEGRKEGLRGRAAREVLQLLTVFASHRQCRASGVAVSVPRADCSRER